MSAVPKPTFAENLGMKSVEDSRKFMEADLARSGLTPADMPWGVAPRTPRDGTERYDILYQSNGFFRTRWNRAENKYISPKGVPTDIFLACATKDELVKARTNAAIEGEKKSRTFVIATGIPAVGLPGCWGFAEPQEEGSESRALRLEILEILAPGKTHIVGLDGDWDTNDNVALALCTYITEVTSLGVNVFVPDFGKDAEGNRLGFDDWMIHTFGPRESWPDQTQVCRTLFSLPEVPWTELEAARTWALSSNDRFNQGFVDKSDRGNATLWLNMVGRANVRYIAGRKGQWMFWENGRWVDYGEFPIEKVNIVSRRYYLRASRLRAIASQMEEGDARTSQLEEAASCLKWAQGRCSSVEGRKALLIDAGNRSGVHCTISDFDVNPDILAVQNGIVDLRTGELRPEERSDMISRRTACDYLLEEPTGPIAARVKQFVREITSDAHGAPNPERERWLRRRIGAGLWGRPSLQSLELWIGKGSNGKTVLALMLQQMLGNYAGTAPAAVILTARNNRDPEAARPFLYKCVGLRFVFMAETKDTAYLDESNVKALTGGDHLSVRRNYGDAEEFNVTFTLVLLTNNLPNIAQGDEAIWDRLSAFAFKCRWNREGKAERDGSLPDADPWFFYQMPKESEAQQWFLWWAVRGSVEWKQEGLGTPPDDVVETANEYRDSQDIFGQWLSDTEHVLSPSARTPSGVLYQSYSTWCIAQGHQPVNNKVFPKRLKERWPGANIHSVNSNGVRYVQGIGPKHSAKY